MVGVRYEPFTLYETNGFAAPKTQAIASMIDRANWPAQPICPPGGRYPRWRRSSQHDYHEQILRCDANSQGGNVATCARSLARDGCRAVLMGPSMAGVLGRSCSQAKRV